MLFFFAALDGEGLAVKRMQSFLTVQPGETLGCVGCHEPRTESARQTSAHLAFRRSPSAVRPIPGVPDVFDFPRDIQPILDRHCVRCHDTERRDITHGPRAGGVILAGGHGPFFSHNPSRSLLLLAPLAKVAGGYGICGAPENPEAGIFKGTDDSDYRVLLESVLATQSALNEVKRFDLPGFRPGPEYVRELKRYGILTRSPGDDTPIDLYATDQAYWKSHWYRPTSQ